MDRIVMFDVETTGLDPQKDRILEIGAMVVGGTSLEVLDVLTFVIRWYDARLKALLTCDRVVYEMHSKSGLLTELDQPIGPVVPDLEEADERVAEWLLKNDFGPGQVMLAGFSVQFDKSFVHAQMPLTAKMLSHRIIDVSTLRAVRKAWVTGQDEPKQDMPHRAPQDCAIARDELARFKSEVCDSAMLNRQADTSHCECRDWTGSRVKAEWVCEVCGKHGPVERRSWQGGPMAVPPLRNPPALEALDPGEEGGG